MNIRNEYVGQFVGRIKALGFRVFVAEKGDYGFITDAEGSRVVTWSFSDGGALGGCYGPPSRESGTGWRLNLTPHGLQTADDVRAVLYANAPGWTGKGWKHYTTLEQHLAMYGASSRYVEA